MKKSKRQKIDEHNYQYWLRENTKGQRRVMEGKVGRPRISTKSQVMLALMSVAPTPSSLGVME